ncbi:RNA polymerase sigma factor [Eisenibacter elegans]|uniref:RNA polymerase sigma factor n=1 Tax=Eisenibacter elegans TaxID=997 RepID=UPI0003F7478F|nr:sigma-70 family RNA polymerase sigma factor [Eisenibacter elegans]
MNKITVEDATLISRYIKGDEEAFAQLVARHSPRVYTTILVVVKDRYTAEDLLQETFIKAIKTLQSGRYQEEGKFLPWLLRVAHNLAIDYLRREKRYPEVVFSDGDHVLNALSFAEDSVETLQIQAETVAQLRNLIQRLPEKQREVLIMRHYAGMSFQEIADATQVSINTALGRMRYALVNLRKALQTPHTHEQYTHRE